jgi:hypothetical protein
MWYSVRVVVIFLFGVANSETASAQDVIARYPVPNPSIVIQYKFDPVITGPAMSAAVPNLAPLYAPSGRTLEEDVHRPMEFTILNSMVNDQYLWGPVQKWLQVILTNLPRVVGRYRYPAFGLGLYGSFALIISMKGLTEGVDPSLVVGALPMIIPAFSKNPLLAAMSESLWVSTSLAVVGGLIVPSPLAIEEQSPFSALQYGSDGQFNPLNVESALSQPSQGGVPSVPLSCDPTDYCCSNPGDICCSDPDGVACSCWQDPIDCGDFSALTKRLDRKPLLLPH